MDNIEFNNVEQVDELYMKLIEEYNEIATQFEELDELDDSVQQLRCLNLDHYDFGLMSEVYAAIDDNYTSNECLENMEECEKEIDDIREKVAGVDLKEHLFKLYNLEFQKEQYEIQIAACEKYLEKCNKSKEMKKKKALIRPASPKRTEEKISIRAASPRRSGGSYTPEKKEKVDDVPKLQALSAISPITPVVPKLQALSALAPITPVVPKPPTPVVAPIAPIVPVVVTVKKTKKSESKPLPVLPLPALTVVETPELPALPTVEAKKKVGRKKKGEE